MASTLGISTLETAVDTTGLDRGLNESHQKAKSSTQQMGDGFKLALGAAATGAALVAANAVKQFVADSVHEFQSFEKATSEVFTLMPGMTDAAMGAMQEDVLAFGMEVGRTTEETVPALYQAISAGVPAENVFDFMKIASDAALGGVTDLETAVDGITSVVNAYGEEVIDAQQASDVMFTAVRLGKTDFESLSSSIANVTPIAASLGVTFIDVAANLAAITAQGKGTAEATTMMRALFTEAAKSGTVLSDSLVNLTGKTFAELIEGGMTSAEIMGMLRDSMPEQAFRDLFSSVEAASGALLITSGVADQVIGDFGGMEDVILSTTTAAETMAGSMEHLQARVDAASQAYKINMGSSLSEGNKLLLQVQLRFYETAGAAAVVRKALADGAITAQEFNRIQDQVIFTSKTWEEAAAELREEQESLRAGLELTSAEMGAWEARAALAGLATEALTFSTRELTEITDEQREAMIAAGEAAQGELSDLEGLTAHQIQHIVQRRIATQTTDAHTAAMEAAAEAERIEAEALAVLEGRLGGYFSAALAAGEETKSFEMTMYEMGQQAGLGAADLAVLAAATGEFSAAEIEAAFQAALMAENINTMVQAVKDGDITARRAVDALGLLQDGQAETAVEAINLANQFGAAEARASAVRSEVIQLDGALNGLTTDISIHIGFDVDALPPLPSGVGSLPDAAGSGPFQSGGWTGYGPENQIAGFVHRQELAVPANVLRGGMDDIMAFARKHVPDGVMGDSGGGGLTINVDARGATDPAAVEMSVRRAVDAALAEAGASADRRMRTR